MCSTDVEYGDPNMDVDKHKSRIKTVAAFKEADRLAKQSKWGSQATY